MKIGVVKELKTDEYRVALAPAGARELVQRGHEVLVETGAGDGSAYPDAAYAGVGARVAASAHEVWEQVEDVAALLQDLEKRGGGGRGRKRSEGE